METVAYPAYLCTLIFMKMNYKSSEFWLRVFTHSGTDFSTHHDTVSNCKIYFSHKCNFCVCENGIGMLRKLCKLNKACQRDEGPQVGRVRLETTVQAFYQVTNTTATQKQSYPMVIFGIQNYFIILSHIVLTSVKQVILIGIRVTC